MDATPLPELTKRQEEILALIIRHYTQKPEPVSSKILAEQSDFNLSSATIRNEMAVLEDLGYIQAPHTSAGRIPTQNGYRYFVKHQLNREIALSTSEQKHITGKFQSQPLATEGWLRIAATVLARTAQSASLVTAPTAEISRYKRLELIAIQGRLVLMVLVLHGGVVQQRMLNLAEPTPQIRLEEAANIINGLFADLSAQQIRFKLSQLSQLEREVGELAVELMEQADSDQTRIVYRDGLSDVIGNFTDGEGAQQMLRVLEERAVLEIILNEIAQNDPTDDVRVIVGGDGRWDEINRLSLIFSRYGVPGQLTGAVGVLGPTHINYGRAISTVRYVSGLMTTMLEDLYNPEE
ncbi:MAG: heat-inducible transcription repressor HrcA [Phototrophicales bacterium]|jgi:heat-inducible transcriptional repressor|nr:MAG: heat-inducible transcription repressor HrcA [Phototrophicales bacterium]